MAKPNRIFKHQQDDSWKPRIITRAPWLGIVALSVVIMLAAASATLLLLSNGQVTTTWRVQPTVLLALISALANAMLRFALTIGVTIAWWRKALSGGTLNDLHRYWHFGSSLWASLISRRKVNVIAIATISVVLASIDGPLLQRAASVTTHDVEVPTNISVQISTTLPYGFTGLYSHGGTAISLLKYPFTKVMMDYSNRAPLSVNISKCDGSCSATVPGVGLSPECTTDILPINIGEMSLQPNGTDSPIAHDKYLVFDTSFMFQDGANSSILMNSIYSNTTYESYRSCPGILITKSCTLRPAIVEYLIHIKSGGVILLDSSNPHVLSESSYPDIHFGDSTFGGVYLAAQQTFASTAFIAFLHNEWNFTSSGSLANRYLQLNQYSLENFINNCNFTFEDPTSDIISAFNEIMFRTAVAAANSSDVQYVQATQTSTELVFKVQYQYLLGAVAVMLFSVAAIVPTFLGFWVIGRETSLSPLEIAKAFNAPLLHNVKLSNAPIEDLVKEIGETVVKYGEVRFKMDHGSMVLLDQDHPDDDETVKRRLEIADPRKVKSPLVGRAYNE